MPRTQNITPKYNLKVVVDENTLHNENYCSLKEISAFMEFPYTTITDIYEGRRKSLNKYEKCKYFPLLTITRLNQLS